MTVNIPPSRTGASEPVWTADKSVSALIGATATAFVSALSDDILDVSETTGLIGGLVTAGLSALLVYWTRNRRKV